jgi:cell division protease FtsH
MKQVLVWLVIALVVFTVFKQFDSRTGRATVARVFRIHGSGQVRPDQERRDRRQQHRRQDVDDKLISTYNPNDLWVVGDLMKFGVKVEGKARDENHLLSILVNWFPMLLLIGVWVFFMRQMQGGGAAAHSRSARARRRSSTRATTP